MPEQRELQLILSMKNQVSGQLEDVAKKTEKLKPQFQKMAIAGGIAFAGLSAGVKVFLDKAGELEQQQVAFTTILGSEKEALRLLGELSDFASKTPFEIGGIRQNAKQLLAMGIEVDKLLPTLKSLGDVSAGLSVPIERLALNFGQVKAQGKLTGRELRDFAIAGVPLLEELADMMGRTKAEIQGMVSAGEIGFPEVEEAFNRMSSEGGKFNDLMTEQSKTLGGLVSNLKDEFALLSETIGAVLLPIAKKLLNALLPMIDSVGKWIAENPKLTVTLIAIAVVLAGLVTTIGFLGLALPSIIAGFTLLAGPIGIIIGLIGLVLIPLIILLVKHWEIVRATWLDIIDKISNGMLAFANLMKDIWEGIKSTFKTSIDSIIGFFQPLINTINKVKSGLGSIGGNISKGASDIGARISSSIPFFANGGIVSKPTLGVVGEAGPEAIVPLSKAGGMFGGLTVIVNGDVSGDELIRKVSESIMDEVRFNQKINL